MQLPGADLGHLEANPTHPKDFFSILSDSNHATQQPQFSKDRSHRDFLRKTNLTSLHSFGEKKNKSIGRKTTT